MSEITIEVTKRCPFATNLPERPYCEYCSSDATVDGDHLDLETIFRFIDSFENISVINLSGGDPLMHPQIGEIILYALRFTENVCLQTNLVRWIRFNSNIVEEVRVEANVLPIAGRSCYIPQNVDRVRILKLIHQGRAKDLPEQNITVSSNFCGESRCESCNHPTLKADGSIVEAPCKKEAL